MANLDLKSCPFCGGDNLVTGGDDKFVGVSCKDCKAAGPNHYGRHEWNDRAPTSDAAKLEAAEGMAQALKVVSAVFQAEMSRSGGKQFSGTWSIPDLDIRATCGEALDRADAALAAYRSADAPSPDAGAKDWATEAKKFREVANALASWVGDMTELLEDLELVPDASDELMPREERLVDLMKQAESGIAAPILAKYAPPRAAKGEAE